MPDSEKVIRAVDSCFDYWLDQHRYIHPSEFETVRRRKAEAIAMLKEQQQIVRCKDCRYGQYCADGETTYQCFKWNSNEFGALHEQDWFCADGVRCE